MKKRCLIVLLIMVSVSMLIFAEGNQEKASWPSRTVQIVAPYGPGGDTDFNARAYSKFLEAELGKPAIVANMAGSGGVTGSRHVKDSNPDGYTVLFFHSGPLLVNEVAGNSDYGIEAFEYVCTAGQATGDIITVRSDMGINTLKELIEYTQANPGKVTLAADIGTKTHILALQLEDAGAKFNVVSAGGAAARVASLKGGHVDVIMNAYGTVADYLETGDFVALATTSQERNKGFSNIPTAVEQGFYVDVPSYYFFAMPKGTPKDIVQKFSAAVKNISEMTEYQDMIYNSFRQSAVYHDGEEGLKDIDTTYAIVNKYRSRFQ